MSQPTYKIAEVMVSVKYKPGVKKTLVVLLGDSKVNPSTIIPNTYTSERSRADVHCRHSSGLFESRRSIKVLIFNDKTSPTFGLHVNAEGRASGEKELIVLVQAASEGDL
ncbi:hypothetical protein DPMN_167493 [Dreissena polymorpha]|uniref:Uncharacterized protein n=1 Tax=Dreissena polymorpha TaxID=45954 RepID=A0A9D4IYU7_DREPO|nr:hypothetical protein DPMN_167493 [Dreissena polymorpha]